MNADQKKRALEILRGYLHYDWVQLPVVVACANEAVGFDDSYAVTPESREFVLALINEERLVVGSLNDREARFDPWIGSREEHVQRIMDQMPLGISIRGEEQVWFDQPERGEPNKSATDQRP